MKIEQQFNLYLSPVLKEGDDPFPTVHVGGGVLDVEASTGPEGGLQINDAALYKALAVALTDAAAELMMKSADAEFDALAKRRE